MLAFRLVRCTAFTVISLGNYVGTFNRLYGNTSVRIFSQRKGFYADVLNYIQMSGSILLSANVNTVKIDKNRSSRDNLDRTNLEVDHLSTRKP